MKSSRSRQGAEVLTDVRDFDGIRLETLHRHDRATDCEGASNDECVGVAAALYEFLFFDIGLEMRHRIYLGDERCLRRVRRCEERDVGLRPIGVVTGHPVMQFVIGLARRRDLAVSDQSIKLLPKRDKARPKVVLVQARDDVRVQDVYQRPPPANLSAKVGRFFGLRFKYSASCPRSKRCW